MNSRRVCTRSSDALVLAYSVLHFSVSRLLILSNSNCTVADSGYIFIDLLQKISSKLGRRKSLNLWKWSCQEHVKSFLLAFRFPFSGPILLTSLYYDLQSIH